MPGVSVTAFATIVVVSGDSASNWTRTMPDRSEAGVGCTITLITSQLDITRLYSTKTVNLANAQGWRRWCTTCSLTGNSTVRNNPSTTPPTTLATVSSPWSSSHTPTSTTNNGQPVHEAPLHRPPAEFEWIAGMTISVAARSHNA